MKKLLNYINSDRRRKEAHDLEREAMQDPFLQEAMDGYDIAKSNPIEVIEKLQNQVSLKSLYKKKKSYNLYWVAAVITLFTTILSLFLWLNPSQEKSIEIASSHTTNLTKEEDETTIPNVEESKDSFSVKNKTEKQKNTENYKIKSEEKVPSSLAYNDRVNAEKLAIPHAPRELSNIYSNSAKIYSSAQISEEEKWYKDNLDSEQIALLEASDKIISDKDKYLLEEKNSIKENIVGGLAKNESKKQRKSKGRLSSSDIALNESSYYADRIGSDATQISYPVIGKESYYKYLDKEITKKFNTQECNGGKGTAEIEFSIDSSGRPENFKVIKSICSSLDSLLIESIKKGPDWTIGEKGGVIYTR